MGQTINKIHIDIYFAIFFDIKLKYLGLFYVLLSLIQIPFSNAGGNIAHLGGAFYGFYYAKNLNKSLNIPALEMLYKYFNSFSKPIKPPGLLLDKLKSIT